MPKLFYIQINDASEGMNAISLVDAPAVEHNFLCFEKQTKMPLEFKDEAKHILTGVVALADTPIYRYNPQLGEYYVVFTKDTIQKMVEKYAKDDLFAKVNLQHDDQRFVDGVYMFESYIVNKDRNIAPVEFADIPDGSWICSFKVEDDELWNEIVNTDHFNGFSLQGVFELDEKPAEVAQSKEQPEIDEIIDEYLEDKK